MCFLHVDYYMLNSLCQINEFLSKYSRLEYILVLVTASNILSLAGASVFKINFFKGNMGNTSLSWSGMFDVFSLITIMNWLESVYSDFLIEVVAVET